MATQLAPKTKTPTMTTRRVSKLASKGASGDVSPKSAPRTPAAEASSGVVAKARQRVASKTETNAESTNPKRGAGSAKTATEYNSFKEFQGRRYTGMKIGRSHKWYYDQGEWKEKKITPDEWQIHYAVTKRRAGKAPEGSGVPVGTGYHWLILAHQFVHKLNANDYSTEMSGLKFKIAHKRADKQTWSASEKAQRKNLIQTLKRVIEDLEKEEASGVAAIALPEAAQAARGSPK